MHSIFKKLLFLWTLFFSSFLFADAGVKIHISDATANEADATMTFTISLSQAPILPVTIDYKTIDSSATAGSDFTAEDDYLIFGLGISSRTFTVQILDDNKYESTEHFYVHASSTTKGYSSDYDGTGTINDDDVDNSLKVGVSCDDVDEGNISESNNIECTISLNRALLSTESDVDIHYESADGDEDPSAKENEDYNPISGDVTFHQGETQKVVYIPTIGDNDIEDDESVDLTISGSSYINDSTGTGWIINDDGSFPKISFEESTLSIIEGNSSQTFLEANITFDKPVLAGSSFTYSTEDDTAEDQWGDNDYIYTENDVNLTGGETYVTIKIPINGDTKIEDDEFFHIDFWNLNKLDWGGENEQLAITIINDDGSFPTMSVDQDTFSIEEGNSSQTTLDFTFTLSKPALANSSFEYYTQHIDTEENDYVEINSTTYIFNGGETNLTIPVTINGDTEVESDETFYLKFNDEKNLTITGTQSPIGKIINDDIEKKPFSCEETSYLFTSDQTADYSDVYFLNLGTGESYKEKRFGTSHINATGYNVQDNYIYGFEYGNDNSSDPTNSYYIVQIDNEFNRKRIDIAGLPKTRFYLGDVSMDGIFYLANRHQPISSDNTLQEIQRIDLNSSTLLSKITLQYDASTTKILTSDFAFNPKDNKLYMVNADNNQLVRVDPISGAVKELGYVGDIGNTYSVISFFDVDGNFYFYTSGTEKIYKIDISNPLSVDATATEFNDMAGIINSGDGARCANAPVTIPISDDEPLVCDETMYLSSSIKRGTGETGKMWLHKINTQKNPFEFDVVDDKGDTKLYNALAYSDSGDANLTDFIFGLYHDELLRIGKNGKAISLGKISALSALLSNRQFYAGAIYNGYYYISGPGVEYNKIFKIKLSDKTVTEINLDKTISLLDFSFTPDGKYLYGIIDGGELVKIDIATGVVTKIGSAHTGYQFDSTFSDKNGRFFANDSKGNGFFEFNLDTGEKLFLSASQKADFNDGANCLNAGLVFTDYGDALLKYQNTWHNIANGIYLGDKIDHDIGSYDTVNADGDDLNGEDDDDGVTLIDGTDINGKYFKTGSTHQLKVKLSKEAYLKIWIDTKINGTFDNGDDLVYNSGSKLSAGEHIITITLPAGLPENTKTYLRARVSSQPSMNPTGFVLDGEVEDYMIYFGTEFTPLHGKFNIERTNSGSYAINSYERNEWYTQIVGRDFDYSLVFYKEDFSAEQNISKIAVKIELINKKGNTPLYERYVYIDAANERSRFDFTSTGVDKNSPSDDLSEQSTSSFPPIPASEDVRFRVTYPKDSSGNIIQHECLTDAKTCFNNLTETKYDDAKDNFSIRPESFYISILDGTRELVNSQNSPASIRLAAGYSDYNLTATATKYLSSLPANGYTKTFIKEYDLNTTGTCAFTEPLKHTINFKDGNHTANFTHSDVGRFILDLNDSNWTNVDQNSSHLGCIPNSTIIPTDTTLKVGCDINLYLHNIEVNFQPDHFAVNLNMLNLPSSGHDDFIYMMNLNANNNDVAIAFNGNITAQNVDNNATSNFTAGCVATNLLLDLKATTISDEGPNHDIHTADNMNLVNFSRIIRFNGETNTANFDVNNTIRKINTVLPIVSNRFLDDRNGSMSLDIRYNLNKTLQQPINPVEVRFHSIDVNSTDANSSAYQIDNHTPSGTRAFPNNRRNFYFARVVSDLNNYPRVNMQVSPMVRTPLNVDIYCGTTTIANYCRDRDVLNHTSLSGTTREQNGWYLSTDHNGTVDGNVTALIPDFNTIMLIPNPTPTKVDNDDITLNHGHTGTPNGTFNNCINHTITVTIATDPVLDYIPSNYTLNCTDVNASQWTGIGKSGNILEITPKVDKSGKMDW